MLSSSPDSISFTEPACTTNANTGLEVSVGAALNSGKYLVSGEFAADNGGHATTLSDPPALPSASAEVEFLRAIDDGTTFVQDANVAVAATPDRIDASLSPSAALLATRVSRPSDSEFASAGYALAAVTFTPITSSTFSVTTTEIARYCELGGTPTFSYDERWLTYHHYLDERDAPDLGFEDASDVNFAAYLSDGAANVCVIDLPTGARHRVTNMAPGQYALYPHFRSDGWLNFVVRDTNTKNEYLAASNAAILAAGD